MADIRCPKCGNTNPDFLDACQFCQTPLHADDALHIGDQPTKKDTGELEEILPSWLKDARQQSRENVGEDATLRSETKPKVQNEAPDLLAGLASQADSDDDEIPDWLAGIINPVAEKTPSGSSAKKDEPSDFFAQFNQVETKPAKSEPVQEPASSWTGTEQPAFLSPAEPEPEADDNSWMNNLGSFDDAIQPSASAGKEPEDLSWLRDLENTAKQSDDVASQAGGGFDFPPSSSGEDLSWLNGLGGVPASGAPSDSGVQPSSAQEDMSWLDNLGGTSAPAFDEPVSSQSAASGEDLSWLNNLGGVPASEEPVSSQPSSSQEDMSWLDNLGSASAPMVDEPLSSQPAASGEDLSWLNNLGGVASEEPVTSHPSSSQEDMSWLDNLGSTSAPIFEEPVASSQPATSGEDLSWLNNLGGVPASEEPVASQPSSSQEDMSWLDNLGSASAPIFEEPAASSQPATSGEDLSWLNNLGGVPASEESVASQPSSSQEDMSWLNNLGGTTAPEEPAPAQSASSSGDLDWLNDLGSASTPAFEESVKPQESRSSTSKPFQTAPLNEFLSDEGIKDTTPDWLKSAMAEEPSMPSLDDLSMDRSSRMGGKPAEPQFDELPASSQPEPASSQSAFDLPFDNSSTSGTADLDSLFNVEMPDWLSNEPESAGTPQASVSTPPVASGDEALAPVELPSWVQAMRPVASSIDGGVPSTVDQVTEREGPLAGFSGVIPSAPIGSSLRPKAFSLKLQVSDEQQAGAALFEQILAGETTAQPLKSTSQISSQRVLRLVLSGVFILVLLAVLALGSTMMPIMGSNQLSNLVATIPDASQVLVVVDYEPSYAGELEATSGPLLDQLARSKRAVFRFVSMSPTGTALVDRLITNTKIAALDGNSYQLGVNYFDLGFLPGGSVGVLGLIEIESANFDAVILMTDNAESGRVWVEQLEIARARNSEIASKPLFIVSSAQSAPILETYESSGQADIVINGLYDAANYEFINTSRPGIARNYWDAFGVGLFMAVVAIILGSVWNILAGIRERRALAEEG